MKVKKVTKKRSLLKNAKVSKKSVLDDSVFLVVRETTLFRVNSANEVMVMSLENQTVYSLANVAAYVWLLIDGSRNVGQIIKDSMKNLKSENSGLEGFVRDLLTDFFDKNLILITTKKVASPRSVTGLDLKAIKKDKKYFMKAKMISLDQRYLVSAGTAGSSTGAGTIGH